MSRHIARLTLTCGLIGLLAISVVSSQEQPKPKFDLYKFDGEDDDSILAMNDLDMFRGMHSADQPDAVNELPDFSRVDDDDDDQSPLLLAPLMASEDGDDQQHDDDNNKQHDDADEWQEPQNKMDLVRFFNGRYYQKQYGKINEYLVDKVGSANVDANMLEVGAWLAREQQRGKNMFLNQATTEALEQFHNLTRVTETGVRCSRQAYSILWKNDRATEGRAHKRPSKLSPPRRVDAIVHQVCLRHAVECLYEYPQKYVQIRASMDQRARQLVETVLDNVLGNVDCVTSKLRSLADQKQKTARHVLESIERHSHEDPDRMYLGKVVDERRGRMAVQADKVGQLVERYLVEPCKYYVRTLGPDVFIPARFDAISLEKEDRYQATSRELVEFLHGWLHYRLCDTLIKRDVDQLTKAVVTLVDKESLN